MMLAFGCWLVGLTMPAPSPMARAMGGARGRVLAQLAPPVPFEDWAEANNIDAPKLAVTGKDELRGVLLECSQMPPFSGVLRDATGLRRAAFCGSGAATSRSARSSTFG